MSTLRCAVLTVLWIVFPDDFVSSTTVPIPKGCNVNLTVSDNYRGITLSSIFGKVLDLIVLMRYSDKLESSRLQFGFKPCLLYTSDAADE